MAWRPRLVDVLLLVTTVCGGLLLGPTISAVLGSTPPAMGRDCRLLWDASFDASVYGLRSQGTPLGEDISGILAEYSRRTACDFALGRQSIILFADLSSPNGALAAVAATLLSSRAQIPLNIVCAPPAYGKEMALPDGLPGTHKIIRDDGSLASALCCGGVLRTLVVDSKSRITFSWTGFDAATYITSLEQAILTGGAASQETCLSATASLPGVEGLVSLTGVSVRRDWGSGDILLHIVVPRCSVCRDSVALLDRLSASGSIPPQVEMITILTQVPLPDDIPSASLFFSESLVMSLFSANAWHSPSLKAMTLADLSRWARASGLNEENVLVDTSDQVLHAWGLRTAPVLVWVHEGSVKQFFQVYWGCGVQPNAMDIESALEASLGG
jgi:hypothetical protein